MAFQFSQAVPDPSCNFTFPCHEDEDQKLLCIKILDDDEHEPDTYFDVELWEPTTDDSNVGAFSRVSCTERERERSRMGRNGMWKGTRKEAETERE